MTVIDNSDGMNSEISVPRAAFESLVRRQIEQFQSPSLNFVGLVHEELNNISQSCLEDESLQLERYPIFRIVLSDVVS